MSEYTAEQVLALADRCNCDPHKGMLEAYAAHLDAQAAPVGDAEVAEAISDLTMILGISDARTKESFEVLVAAYRAKCAVADAATHYGDAMRLERDTAIAELEGMRDGKGGFSDQRDTAD